MRRSSVFSLLILVVVAILPSALLAHPPDLGGSIDVAEHGAAVADFNDLVDHGCDRLAVGNVKPAPSTDATTIDGQLQPQAATVRQYDLAPRPYEVASARPWDSARSDSRPAHLADVIDEHSIWKGNGRLLTYSDRV